jgi:hypothetical protein
MAIRDFGASRSVVSAITITDFAHADHLAGTRVSGVEKVSSVGESSGLDAERKFP